MIHFSPGEEKVESTRTRVLREPELVPIQLIRPTEAVSPRDCRKIGYSPICLVKHSNGLLYIVDGNHRFHKKAYFEEDCSKILAWILREGDQDKIEGNRIPGILAEWKGGKITLEELAELAYAEANPPRAKPKQVPPAPMANNRNKSVLPIPAIQIRGNPEWPAPRKFELVIKLIKNELSMEEASRKYSLPRRTIEEWIHISIRAMREALQD